MKLLLSLLPCTSICIHDLHALSGTDFVPMSMLIINAQTSFCLLKPRFLGLGFGRNAASLFVSFAHPASEQVCTFLAPLLQKGLVRAHAEAVCDLPGLGVFADVPLKLSIEIEEGIFALDPGAANEQRVLAKEKAVVVGCWWHVPADVGPEIRL